MVPWLGPITAQMGPSELWVHGIAGVQGAHQGTDGTHWELEGEALPVQLNPISLPPDAPTASQVTTEK